MMHALRGLACWMTCVFVHSHVALARFDASAQRSIEFTGETLPDGYFEMGLRKLMYGVTDNLMIETNLGFDVLAGWSAGAAYRLNLTRNLRLTPSLGYFRPKSNPRDWVAQGALSIGMNRGDHSQHSLAVNVAGRNQTWLEMETYDETTGEELTPFRSGRRNSLWLGFDYSYYTPGGNLAYVGSDQLVPYFGFTWAWENLHAGFVLAEINSWSIKAWIPADLPFDSNFSYFLPLPYVYFRF